MISYEDCRTHLEELKEQFEETDASTLNEANTRFKFIDSILIDCLNWDKDDISCEDSFEGKYTDYVLSLFRSVAVVEAKKSGDYFELPVGKQKLFQPLKSVYKDNKNIKEAIDQVMGYCHRRSIQLGIVCNGWQIIAFIANRNDSIPPLEGNALVVQSLNSWKSLKKSGTACQKLV